MQSRRSPLTWRIYAVVCGGLLLLMALRLAADWAHGERPPADTLGMLAVVFLIVGRFAWGLWSGQRLMLVGLIGHCAIWFFLPFAWWLTLPGKFEVETLLFWLPILLYLPPLLSGVIHWKEMGERLA